jgi:hypothetical protein
MIQANLFETTPPPAPVTPREGTDSPDDMAVQCRDCTFWKTSEQESYFRAMHGTCKHHGEMAGWWTCGQFQTKGGQR